MRMDSTPKVGGAEARPAAIGNDRALLNHLRISDTDAGMFLGRSRQTLITRLGPKKPKDRGQPPPRNYFSLPDIVLLVSAARQLGRTIDANAIRDYVDETRRPRETDPQETYLMLIGLLGGSSEPFELTGADTVVFVMPGFAELRAHRRLVAEHMRTMVQETIPNLEEPPGVYLLATTNFQAQAAGAWLGIPKDHCFGSEVIEHYLPSILVYRRNSDEPSPYVLTEDRDFVAAPRFMNHLVADCVRSLLPSEVGQKMLPVQQGQRRVSGGD